jgi:hypothetical protein
MVKSLQTVSRMPAGLRRVASGKSDVAGARIGVPPQTTDSAVAVRTICATVSTIPSCGQAR